MARKPNGDAVANSIDNGSTPDVAIEVPAFPAVVGINYGNSYASIAVLTKEGQAECIANEDGERQIACAISFHSEETYIGNQARPQLVKNAQNTIVGFRDLLGKKFSEVSQSEKERKTSAPVIAHPTEADTPAYSVQVLTPAPAPLPTSTPVSAANSIAPTPRSEPTPATRILSARDVNVLFLRALIQSAQDFLGRDVTGAVVSVPAQWSEGQKEALKEAAKEAGVEVLQVLDEAGAAAVATSNDVETSGKVGKDLTQLVVDLGSSALALALIEVRDGLVYARARAHSTDVRGSQLDDALVTFFAKEFTKKTKTPLTLATEGAAPASETDRRAEAKLRLAVEHTRRTLSASSGAASCSVESLKDGLDFTGTINRARFDLLVRNVYSASVAAVLALCKDAGLDQHEIDEVVYAGGAASLPGLDDALAGVLREDAVSPFVAGTVVGGGVGDPTTVLARGCALQARIVAEAAEDVRRAAFGSKEHAEVGVLQKSIGVVFPVPKTKEGKKLESHGDMGGVWTSVVARGTPVPARRAVQFTAGLEAEGGNVAFELWEVRESVRVEMLKPPKPEQDDEDEEEEEDYDDADEEETRLKIVERNTYLGSVKLPVSAARKGKDGRWSTKVEVQFVVGEDGGVVVRAWEVGKDGKAGGVATVQVPAASA